MNQNDPELTAYCGLYCCDCIRYKCKVSDLSDNLLGEIEKHHFLEYAEVKKNHTKEFEHFKKLPALLEAISNIKCETACRAGGDGCDGSCPIIACVKRNSIDGCWQCNDFEKCDKLQFLIPFHGESIKNNLKLIQQYGIKDWVEFREKCYPWL